MDQVKITHVRRPVRDPPELDAFGHDFVGGRNGVVPWIANLPEAELPELILAQLKQADIRSGALIRVETGFDLGNRHHEIEIETKRVGSALDLFGGRSDRNVLERTQDDLRDRKSTRLNSS